MWLKLSKRMQIIADEIKNSGAKNLIDIGCDHGYIPIYLLKEKIVSSAVLVDISKQSLEKAIELGNRNNIENVQYICTDGLKGVQIANNSVVSMSGMGGAEIISIISDVKPELLVLSPQKNVYELRVYLQQFYEFVRDYIVADNGKFYFVISLKIKDIKKSYDKLSYEELLFGKTSLIERNETFYEYLSSTLSKLNKILVKMNKLDSNYQEKLKIKEACEKLLREF